MRKPTPPSRGLRAFGPIPVRGGATSLGPPFLRTQPGTIVDLGPYRGSLIPMARGLIQRLLGLGPENVVQLELAEALSPSDERNHLGGLHLLFDPAWTATEVYDAWATRQPMPVHHADFVPFETMRLHCRLPDDYPYPEHLLEGMFQRLVEIGNFSRVEAAAFLSLNDLRWRSVSAWLCNRLGRFCAERATTRRVTLEMTRLSLPPVLRTCPRTCFEPIAEVAAERDEAADRGDEAPAGMTADGDLAPGDDAQTGSREDRMINAAREAPSAATRRSLWGMGELHATAAIYALTMAPILRRADVLERHVRIMIKVEAIMHVAAPGGGWNVSDYHEAFRAYAIDQTILPGDPPGARYVTVRMFRIIIARVHMFLRRRSRSFSAAAKPLVAPNLTLPLAFRKELRDEFGHLIVAGQEARKRMTHNAMNDLDLIVEAARNRRNEMRSLGEAYRLETEAFARHEAHREVGVELPVLDERGGLAGGTQKVWLRVWHCNGALESMGRPPLPGGLVRRPGPGRPGEAPGTRPEFIAEYLDTVPVGRATSREPWMLELDRLGVGSRYGRAEPNAKEARHRAIIERDLPGWVPTAAGTLNFDLWRGHIRRFGLEANRHFAPIEQAEYGMRLAFHALDCVNQSYNRIHEVRQQTRGGWRVIDLPPELRTDDDEPWFRQDVIGKVPRWRDLADVVPVPLAIRESSRLEAIELTQLHKRHAGLKVFPTMTAPSDFKWKCGPGQFVISSFGRPLDVRDLNVLLDYLLVGWEDYGFHDFRHGEAEDAALDGYSDRLIAFLLGQADIDNALYYSQLPDWARDIVDQQRLRRRQVDQDRRLLDWSVA